MIKHSQLVLGITPIFITAEIQLAQHELSLTTTLSLMEMSAAQTHAHVELVLTSFQTTDATAPLAMGENDVKLSEEGYASLLDMVVICQTEMDGSLVIVIPTFE